MTIEETSSAFVALTGATEKLKVALSKAEHVVATTKAMLDWDPLEHPRDVYGMFVKKGTGTFLYGKTKKATFMVQPGGSNKPAHPVEYPLGPGDALYKTGLGNHFVLHPDGSINFLAASDDKDTFLPVGGAVNKVWTHKVQTKSDVTLIDYSPAVLINAPDEHAAQTALDNKALALADAYTALDNHVGESGGLSEGAVAYTAPGDPGYVIKHEGNLYYYPTPQTAPGDAIEVAPADYPKYEKFNVAVNAHHDKAKADQIKKDVLDGPALADWEKELLKGADEVKTPAPKSSMITFKGYAFYPGSKFYEHNKTANSYLVVEPNASWKIDKTGKKISGAQAVQYLHNYHDITPTVVPEGTPAPAADDYSLVGHHGVGTPPKPKVTPADVKGKTPAEVAAMGVGGSFYKSPAGTPGTPTIYFIPNDKSFYAVAHTPTSKFSYAGDGTDLAGNLAVIETYDPFNPTAKATPIPNLSGVTTWNEAAPLLAAGGSFHMVNKNSAVPPAGHVTYVAPDDSYYVWNLDGKWVVTAKVDAEAAAQEGWYASDVKAIKAGAAVFPNLVTGPNGGVKEEGGTPEATAALDKKATIDSLPDGTLIVDPGPGMGFAVKTEGSFSVYDPSGNIVQTIIGSGASVKDTAPDIFKSLMETAPAKGYAFYFKGYPSPTPEAIQKVMLSVPSQSDIRVSMMDGLVVFVANHPDGLYTTYSAVTGQKFKSKQSSGQKAWNLGVPVGLTAAQLDAKSPITMPFGHFPAGTPIYKNKKLGDAYLVQNPDGNFTMWKHEVGGGLDASSEFPGWSFGHWDHQTYLDWEGKPTPELYTAWEPIIAANVATLTPKSKAAAPKAEAAPAKHEVYYPHPAGPKMVLQPGQKLYQHNKVPESFLVVSADGLTAVKYDKTGKVLNGHQQLAVLYKNYTDITWQAENYTTANPVEEAAGTLAQAVKTAKKAPVSKKPPITKKAAALGKVKASPAHVDSGVPGIGWMLAFSKVYQKKADPNVYIVVTPSGEQTEHTVTPSHPTPDYTVMSHLTGGDAYPPESLNNTHWFTDVTPGAQIDTGIPGIGKVPTGSTVYKSNSNTLVWMVKDPSGSWTRYEKNPVTLEVKSSNADGYMTDDSVNNGAWEDITALLPLQSADENASLAQQAVPPSIWSVMPDDAKVYKATTGKWLVETYPDGKWTTQVYVLNDDKTAYEPYIGAMKASEENFHKSSLWELVYDGTATTVKEPQPVEEPTPVDFEAGYVIEPGDKVYLYGGEYEVIDESGNYIGSFTHYNEGTHTASGKGIQVGPKWQGGWSQTLLDNNAKVVDTGTESASFEPDLSTPGLKSLWESLPSGWELVVADESGTTAYVYDPGTDTYFGVYSNGTLTGAESSPMFQPEFIDAKDKALYGDGHYYVKPGPLPKAPTTPEPEPTGTFVKAEAAPKSFSAASVKVTSANFYSDSGDWIDGWQTVHHKDAGNHIYFLGKPDGASTWSVWTSTGGAWSGNKEVVASGFKTLKDAKYWVSQNAAHKPKVFEPVDPNAPQTMVTELNGVAVYLPSGSTVYSYESAPDAKTYLVFTPHKGNNVEVSPDGSLSSGYIDEKELGSGYYNLTNITKVAQTAVPEYTLPTPKDVDISAVDVESPYKVWNAATLAMKDVDWTGGSTPAENALALSTALALVQKYREKVTGSAKAKATKAINGLTKALALTEYDQYRADGKPIPADLATFIMKLPNTDVFKGADVYWSMKHQTASHFNLARVQLQRDYFVQSAKALSGKDVPLAFLLGQSEDSGFTLDEAKEFLAKQGFEYVGGLTSGAAVNTLLRSYLVGSPVGNMASATAQAKKNLQYAKAVTDYAAWQTKQAKEKAKPPTKAAKKAAAKAKIDWAAAQVAKAQQMKSLREDFDKQFPDGVTYAADTIEAAVKWINENAGLDYTIPPFVTPDYTFRQRAGIASALTGNPLFGAFAQVEDLETAYTVNTPEWEAFAAWAPTRPWYGTLTASVNDPIDITSPEFDLAVKDFGLDIPAFKGKSSFKATLMSRVVLNANKVLQQSSAIDVEAKKHLGTKVADPTLLPAERPEWANEFSWAIVGLTLAGQPFEMDPSVNNVDLGTAYKVLQSTQVPGTGVMAPLYKWSEFPISDPKMQALVRFARGQMYSDSDPARPGVRDILAYLASLGYWESPLAVEKDVEIPGAMWSAHLTLLPGDKVHKINNGIVAVEHQSGAMYQVSHSYNGQSEAAVDKDYWAEYIEKPVLYTQPVLIDKEYAAAHGFSGQLFDEYMTAKDAKYADLDYPGMAGVSKGESLVFMKKWFASHEKYKAFADKMPSLPEGALKYLHYSAKAGLDDPFDFTMLLDSHGQFDAVDTPNLTVYKTPNGAPWAEQMAKYGAGADAIYSQWGDQLALQTYETVLGKKPSVTEYMSFDDAEELSNVLTGKVLWTDPNAAQKKADKAAKGTLVFTEIVGKTYGGMHTKFAWADQNGNEWMSKAFASDPNAKARVDAEHYACEIARLYGYDAPESRIQTMKGDYAYVQYIAPAAGNFEGHDWHDVPADLTAKVMTEHILDWVISNHDSHGGNLMFTPDKDDFFGIDKGQAFKFFPDDQLAEGYLPPGNPVPVWYDAVYKAIRTKAMPKEQADQIVDTVLRKAAYVSVRHDESFRDMLEHAFQNRNNFPPSYPTREKFIDGLVARKTNVFDDFEKLYKGLYDKAGWEWPGKAKDDYLPKKIGPAHVAVTPDFAADVMASKSSGQSLFFAGPDLEDGNMIFYTTVAPDKSTVLRAETKLRADADKTFTAWLQQHTIKKVAGYEQATPATPDHTTLYGIPEAFNALKNYVMTVNHHAEDKEYNASTINSANEQHYALAAFVAAVEAQIADDPLVLGSVYNHKFVTAEQQHAWLDAAKTLIDHFEQVDKAHEEQVKSPFNVTDNPLVQPAYKPTSGIDTSGKPKVQSAYKLEGTTYYKWSDGNYVKMFEGDKYVASTEGEYTKAAHDGDEVVIAPEVEPDTMTEVEATVSVANKVVSVKQQPASTYPGAFNHTTLEFEQSKDTGGHGMTGHEYEISYDNITVKYMPWHGAGVARAQEGLLRMEVRDWDGTEPDIEGMLAVLRDTGLSLSEADETDLEILYWRRLAGIVGDRASRTEPKSAALLAAVAKIQGMESKVAERDALRAAWEVFYGHDGVQQAVKDRTYLPFFSAARVGPDSESTHEVGRPIWNRPKSGVSYHDIYKWTNGKLPRHDVTYGGTQENMRQVLLSGWLLSTEERTRVVGWFSGASSSGDQSKGSSAFNYFRQKQSYEGWDFIAEPHVYYRDSNYSFSWDAWGDLDARANEGKFDIEDTIHYGGTELLLKNWVSVMSDLAVAVISDYSLRQEVINFYKSLGITEIRGLPIEERFVASSADAYKTVEKVWQMAFDREKEGVA